MQFEVHGTPYLLTFHEDSGEWLLLTPARNGLRGIEIKDDGGPLAVPVEFEEVNGHEGQPLN